MNHKLTGGQDLMREARRPRPRKVVRQAVPPSSGYTVKEKHPGFFAKGHICSGLGAEDPASTPGSEPRKVALALEIRQNTTVTHRWLAENLFMRSAANTSQQLHRARPAQSSARRVKGGRQS